MFFVDDNLTADLPSARELFSALRPLKIRWFSQAGIQRAERRIASQTDGGERVHGLDHRV